MARLAAALGVLSVLSIQPAFGQRYCPVHGPAFPVPTNLSNHPLIRSAVANLSATLDQVTRGGNEGIPYPANVTSSSIGLLSIHDEGDIFQYHHTASVRNDSLGGTSNVTGDTVYRIASISKMFTVLSLLMQDGKLSLEDPVTKYIPQLATAAAERKRESEDDEYRLEDTHWDEVTLHALASQLAGTPTEPSTDPTLYTPELQVIGLPPLNESEAPTCGATPWLPVCSREQYISDLDRRRPVFPPYGAVVYNNAAYDILGLVIEAVTNKTYDVVLQDQIFGPLNMTRTSVTKPADNSVGIIPEGLDLWTWDLGPANPGGGLYSSTNDLLKLGRAILRGDLLGQARTKAWLKPAVLTSSLDFAIGAPWEISRTSGLTPDGRVIDLYTKAGGLIQYTSLFILVPDYDLVMTVMIAGTQGGQVIDQLTSLVLTTMISAVDQVAREQALALYGGSYASAGSNYSISVTVDEGPGLKVDRWIAGGLDVLKTLKALQQRDVTARQSGQVVSRLYPTGLISTDSAGANGTSSKRVGFRAVTQFETAENSTTDNTITKGLMTTVCGTWAAIDRVRYGLNALDDIVFHLDSSGDVEAIEPRGWRVVVEKQGNMAVVNSTSAVADGSSYEDEDSDSTSQAY